MSFISCSQSADVICAPLLCSQRVELFLQCVVSEPCRVLLRHSVYFFVFGYDKLSADVAALTCGDLTTEWLKIINTQTRSEQFGTR